MSIAPRSAGIVRVRSIYASVGLFIVLGIVVLIGVVWLLGGMQVNHPIAVESYFRESMVGLDVGAPVEYRGVTIGRVTNLGLINAEYGSDSPAQIDLQSYRLVFVRYVIDRSRLVNMPGLPQAVTLGLRARLASTGITGLSYIELDFVDPERYPAQTVPWQPKTDYIPSMPSALTEVEDAAQQVLAKLDKVDFETLTASVTNFFDVLHAETATGDLQVALIQTHDLLRTLDDALRRSDLRGLVADLRSTSGVAREVLTGNDSRRLTANAAVVAERLETAAAKLPTLPVTLQITVQRIRNGTADVQQWLTMLLLDMQGATQNLRELTEALRRNPVQVLLSQPPPRSMLPTR